MSTGETLTIVLASDRTVRLSAQLARLDERFLYVIVDGEERRFSRTSGFELPAGGSWGTWRLSGKDLRRTKSW